MHIVFQVSVLFSSSKYLEVELLEHMVVLFLTFWRKLCAVFHDGCTNSLCRRQCTRVPALHILASTYRLTMAVPTGVRRERSVVVICVVLMIRDAEALFTCPLALCLLWKSVCSGPLSTFQLCCLGFFAVVFRSSLYILDLSPLSDTLIAAIFSHSVGSLLFADGFHCCAEALSVM